jgi:hypothetical protein
MNKVTPDLINRLVRILILVLVLLLLRRIPGRLLFVVLESGGTLLIIGSILYGWRRLTHRSRPEK